MTQKDERADDAGNQRQLRPGIKLLAVSFVLAIVSLLLFGYSLQWSFAPPADGQPVDVKRIPLGLAMLGFGVSTLVFWTGYMSLARR